ncbi:MAG TPA: hypothetical protein VHY79_09635 [Rhizomicrobium sp.]|jgi:hypothetical protein|nr:hypothetical protein [Rhizomicrobium sp.]
MIDDDPHQQLSVSGLALAAVSLAALFAKVLSKENPGLRSRLESEATAEFRRLNLKDDKTAAAVMATFLGELHAIPK